MKEKLAILGGARAVPIPPPAYNPLGEEEEKAALEVIRSGQLSLFFGSAGDNFLGGPQVKALEQEWSEYFQVAFSVSMNSATSGLIAAVGACAIGPGDEVIVSPYTMTASASCVRVFGGTPVFADIDPDTFNLSLESIKKVTTDRTKAIIIIDLAGQPADLADVMNFAKARGIRVIEDASQAPGAKYRDMWAGTIGDIGIFSLNCHKTIQTGEGGMCCTNDPDLAARLQLIRNHGEAVVEEFGGIENPESILGFNFRLGEVEAAMGREQLKKLRYLTEPRQDIARIYNERLSQLEGLTTPVTRPDRTHVYYFYMLKVDAGAAGITRPQLIQALQAEGVDCYEGYCRPLYLQPLYQAPWPLKGNRFYGPGLCPVAEDMFSSKAFFHGLLYNALREPWVEQICEAFEKIWRHRDQLSRIETKDKMSVRRA